jgi:GNAT superfamily N-acetyltransferase
MPDMAASKLRVQRLCIADLPAAQALSADVGWPHRADDWRFVHRLGHGFALIDGSAELVGTALWWPFGSEFAALGMVIVSPKHQRQGLGRVLLDAVLDAVDSRSALLNSTRDGVRLYESAGFRAIGSVRQYQGIVGAISRTPPRAGGLLRPLEQRDLSAVIALDKCATGLPRDGVLAQLLPLAEGLMLERAGGPAGFSFFRRFGRGHVVGPVIAHDKDGARALVRYWLDRGVGTFVRIDTPVGDSDSWDWLTEAGLRHAGTVTTMIRGEAPRKDGVARIFALINQALG